MYSEELLDVQRGDSEVEIIDDKESEVETIDDNGSENECQMESIDDHEMSSQLESIKDLISIEDHLYHKLRSNDSPFNLNINSITAIDNNNNNKYILSPISTIDDNSKHILSPLSPLSCNSDSGYESVPSPTLCLGDQLIDSSDVNLDDSISELFPDLV